MYLFNKPIKSLHFRSFVVSVLFARFHFKVVRKSLETKINKLNELNFCFEEALREFLFCCYYCYYYYYYYYYYYHYYYYYYYYYYAAYTFGLKHRWTYFLRTLPDIQDLLEPLEDAISHMLIPAITERKCNQLDRNILALPVRLGGLGLGNPSLEARHEYASSVKVTKPLVEQIVSQSHQLPEDSLTKLAQQEVRSERSKELEHRAERIKEMAPRKKRQKRDHQHGLQCFPSRIWALT